MILLSKMVILILRIFKNMIEEMNSILDLWMHQCKEVQSLLSRGKPVVQKPESKIPVVNHIIATQIRGMPFFCAPSRQLFGKRNWTSSMELERYWMKE
jgi:hypothetical protein